MSQRRLSLIPIIKPLSLSALLCITVNSQLLAANTIPTPDQPASSEAKQDTTAEDKADGEEKEAEEESVLSQRLDPKHQQYMGGQLAYWFEMYEEAFGLWLPLAEEGEKKSQANIGWLYHQGLGVEQNFETALEWYQKSAAQEYVIAQHNLGTMYEHGWGVAQDYAEAAKWYQLGVEKAYGPSLYNMAMFYLNGQGIEKNRDMAIHHLRSAHELKVSKAAEVLKELGIEVEERKPILISPGELPDSHP